jgi:hypothetical protein
MILGYVRLAEVSSCYFAIKKLKNSCTEFRISLPLRNSLCHFDPILYIFVDFSYKSFLYKNNAYALVHARS